MKLGTKDVFTTGEVAKICNVAPRTVSKWFDSGQLRGYRIPGSKDRRIPKAQLLRFMRAHNIPMGELESGQTHLLIVDNDSSLCAILKESLEADGLYEVTLAPTAFEAGVCAGTRPPHVMIVDVSLPDLMPNALGRAIRANEQLQGIKVIGVSGGISKGQSQALVQDGFDAFLRKPFEIRELITRIEQVTAEH
jgi:excisionase family DNA binding protein